jgi:hypothetical protein
VLYVLSEPFGGSCNYIWGYGQAPAGDVNGDDYPDYLIGGPTFQGASVGEVHLISGSPVGVSTYGTACPTETGSVPRIAAGSTPTIGTSVMIRVSNVTPGLTSLLFLGVSNALWGGIPLPLHLAIVGMPGCYLWSSIDAIVPVVTTAVSPGVGVASFNLLIPNNGALLGLSLYSQWFVVNASGGPPIGAMSKGLQLAFQ